MGGPGRLPNKTGSGTIISKVRQVSRERHRTTRQGGAVRDALAEAGGFRSAQDVYAALRSEGDTVGLSTVYRHLQAFADQGLVDVIHTPDGESTYRYCG